MILPCSVQNFKAIGQLNWMLCMNEFSQHLSLRSILERSPLSHSTPVSLIPLLAADIVKLTGPWTFADKRWVEPVKLLCIIMFNTCISKMREKFFFTSVAALIPLSKAVFRNLNVASRTCELNRDLPMRPVNIFQNFQHWYCHDKKKFHHDRQHWICWVLDLALLFN